MADFLAGTMIIPRQTSRIFHGTGDKALTLIELLVTIAITALMLVLLAQISSNTLQTARISRQRLEAAQYTRTILDALDTDLTNLVSENGLTIAVTTDTNNNTQLAFLTRERGPNVSGSDTSRIIAVSYQLTGNEIQRKITPVSWNTLDLIGATTSATNSSVADSFGNGILRFEACAILNSGSCVPLAQTGSWKETDINGQTICAPYNGLVLKSPLLSATAQHVRSIVVAVASLDEQNLNLPNAKNMGSSLPPAVTGTTPMETWNAAILSGSLAHYPRPAFSALHLDQRTYQLK